uniref:Uncharacterized protein n=1 Tax=Plectus sambesii TaxID=2011161 RepID=A0A914WHR7_9BILA
MPTPPPSRYGWGEGRGRKGEKRKNRNCGGRLAGQHRPCSGRRRSWPRSMAATPTSPDVLETTRAAGGAPTQLGQTPPSVSVIDRQGARRHGTRVQAPRVGLGVASRRAARERDKKAARAQTVCLAADDDDAGNC